MRAPFKARETRPGRSGPLRAARGFVFVGLVALVACGETPLESIGWRSSEWINEPTVPTTVPVVVTTPTIVTVDRLFWANDDIVTENLDDPGALLAEVFSRREGDRFIQASRFEIAAALEDVKFPGNAPVGAEWVSSQLVFNNDGTVADEPSVAFGIWSAEPYTRSRSVAQMIVLRVSTDVDAAAELASGDAEVTCARFSDRTTDRCEVVAVGDNEVWMLTASAGTTLVWFDGPYRYELYGRSFVTSSILRDMAAEMVPLDSIGDDAS